MAALVLLPLALLAAGGGPALGQGGTSCPGDPAPTPTAVTVDAVPIVVTSTTADYFVLYVTFDAEGTELEVPVAVTRGEAGTTTLAENLTALPAARYRVKQYQVADPADVDGDCIDDVTELDNLGSMNPVNPAMIADPNDGVVAVPDLAAFQALGTGVYGGTVLKFVLLNLDTAHPALYFMNTKLHGSHVYFFEAVGLQREGAITGTITYDPGLTVPDRGVGGFYYEYFPRLGAESFPLAEQVHTVLAANLGVIDDNLTLYVDSVLLPLVQERLPQFRASRIPLVFDSDLYGDVEFLALNTGTGYGRLRILEADERPHPRDIIVSATLPNELPRVAGILTAAPQTPLSHVNLRAVQDGIPNAYVKDALDHADVIALEGSYVRYEVAERWWELRAATLQEVEAHYESARPAETQTPQRDLSITQITPLDQIGFHDWKAFGVKAANLAVLRTLGFPAGTIPDGFAIPFSFYDEFLQQPLGQETVFGKGSAPAEEKLTLAAETTLFAAVEAILAHPKFQTDFDIQDEMLDDLRDAIKDAQSPQWMIDALTAMHATYPEGQSLRYRSSTNNEDLPGFNGAGLYDSKTQHPDETEENGIDKSFKQVLAGLWTFRAFSERAFHRVDHLAAAMGVLVHPNFSAELVNGVAVSFDPVTARTDRYYVNSQVGEDLVTNPEAGSVPEEIVLLSGDGLVIRAFSNLVEPGDLLMSGDQMSQLRAHLTTIRDHFEGLYDPTAGEPFAMEIEFKITSANILAIKQARPWVFGPDSREALPDSDPVSPDPGDGGGGGGGDGGGGGGGGGGDGGSGGGGGGGSPVPESEPEPEPESEPNVPPTAAFAMSVDCAGKVPDLCTARTGVPVRFTDTSSGTVRQRAWDFGDGSLSKREAPDHQWSEPGFYTVTLTVSDGSVESSASRVFLVTASDPAGSCEPDRETLCLRDSRYSVRAEWWTVDGESGRASVVQAGTNDSGLFRFFGADNWEMLVKVLDGCELNGHTWVFGASVTDLGYAISLTDTVTGEEKEYLNEPGTSAASITDTTAFRESCGR